MATALLMPSDAGATGGQFQLGDAYVRTSGTKANLRIAAKWDRTPNMEKGPIVLLFLKAPIGDVSDDTYTFRITELSSQWRLGLGYRLDFLHGESDDDAKGYDALGLAAEWGCNQFAWYPGGQSEAEKIWKHSGAVKIYWTGYRTGSSPRKKAWEISMRYSHEYEASREVGVVRQDETTGLDIATDMRVAPPKVIPSATARIFLFVDNLANMGTNAAIGPTLSYTSSGDGSDAIPNGGNRIFRMELWAYWFPVSEAVNLRFGVAPYLDYYIKGNTKDGQTAVVGGLFQIKTGVPFVY